MRLRIYVDTASVEVFGGRGEWVLTDQVFPDDDSRAATSAPKVATPPPATSTYHYTPATNLTNDAYGLIRYRGVYQLFYQHNPAGDTAGNRVLGPTPPAPTW